MTSRFIATNGRDKCKNYRKMKSKLVFSVDLQGLSNYQRWTSIPRTLSSYWSIMQWTKLRSMKSKRKIRKKKNWNNSSNNWWMQKPTVDRTLIVRAVAQKKVVMIEVIRERIRIAVLTLHSIATIHHQGHRLLIMVKELINQEQRKTKLQNRLNRMKKLMHLKSLEALLKYKAKITCKTTNWRQSMRKMR